MIESVFCNLSLDEDHGETACLIGNTENRYRGYNHCPLLLLIKIPSVLTATISRALCKQSYARDMGAYMLLLVELRYKCWTEEYVLYFLRLTIPIHIVGPKRRVQSNLQQFICNERRRMQRGQRMECGENKNYVGRAA